MQTRIWDFSEIDATKLMNDAILAILRKRNAGLPNYGQLRPGRLVGFIGTANSPANNKINFVRDGFTTQMAVTKDGVIVVEDADIDDVATFGNISSANPRIDIVAIKHSYSASLPNTAARYVVISGTPDTDPSPNYAGLAVDESPLAEIYIDPTPGIGNPPDISDSDIHVLPSALDLLIADHEPSFGRTDNEFGDSGIWARLGRNQDRFYMMRDPEDSNNVLLVLNALYEPGTRQRVAGTDGQCQTGAYDSFISAGSDFELALIKPGDELVILVGANTGTYTIAEVLSSTTIKIVGTFPSTPTTGEQFNVKTKGASWYQEDSSRRSFLVSISDKIGVGNELFGLYKADVLTQGDVFGTFWSSILSSTEDGDLTWPLLFAGQNLVYGCHIMWESIDQIKIGKGNLYNNSKFRQNLVEVTLDINNAYNAGTSTWGRRSGEAKSTGWWYVYATTDISGNGFGIGISKTSPDKFTLQHPSDVDWRWIGSVYYRSGTPDHWRRFNKIPSNKYHGWADDLESFSLIPLDDSTLHEMQNLQDIPRTSSLAQFYIDGTPGPDSGTTVYFGLDQFPTQQQLQYRVARFYIEAFGTNNAISSTAFQWPVSDEGKWKARRTSGCQARYSIMGFWEDINSPLSTLGD